MEEAIADTMKAMSMDAVKIASDLNGAKLDFSEASVITLERILQEVVSELASAPKDTAKYHDFVETLADNFGAYLGEVMRCSFGGTWVFPSRCGENLVGLRFEDGSETAPASKVYKRIVNGDEDDVVFYYECAKQNALGLPERPDISQG